LAGSTTGAAHHLGVQGQSNPSGRRAAEWQRQREEIFERIESERAMAAQTPSESGSARQIEGNTSDGETDIAPPLKKAPADGRFTDDIFVCIFTAIQFSELASSSRNRTRRPRTADLAAARADAFG
jgi:hypothetical protein